jgi:hypothetical protein
MTAFTLDERTVLTSQQYAIRLLQMLQDYGEDLIKVDTILVVVKMLTRHPIDNAVLFATGDAYQFGALEFNNQGEARVFLGRLSENVAYAAFLDGRFEIYQYPYQSQVIGDWVFVGFERAERPEPVESLVP